MNRLPLIALVAVLGWIGGCNARQDAAKPTPPAQVDKIADEK